MPRNPRAATTLITELRSVVPDLDVEADDRDGLGVYRTFRLKSEDFKGLADVIAAVADRRIVQSKVITGGVEVTFTHLALADGTDPFNVADAQDLVSRKRQPAKKAAAKKAESKSD